MSIDNDVLNENITKIINDNNNSAEANIRTTQNMTISNVQSYCQLDITQQAKADIKTVQKIDSKVQAKIAQEIITQLENDFKNSAKAKSGWGSFPAVSVAATTVKNNIRNRLSSETFLTNTNEFIARVSTACSDA